MTDVEEASAGDLYDGPYVHSRQVDATGRPWVWIANGLRPAEQRFSVPTDLPVTVAGLVLARPEPGPPSAPEAPPRPTVRVLGAIEVENWPATPDRAMVLELGCFLALHPGRTYSGDELRFALRPDADKEISAKSLRTYISLLRSALGPDLVPSATASGYSISPNVGSDWAEFVELSGVGASKEQLWAALELVRGRPFEDAPPGSYGWIYSELLMSEMEERIAAVTVRLASKLIVDFRFEDALAACRRGLLGVPNDQTVWERYLASAWTVGAREWVAAVKEAWALFGEDTDLVKERWRGLDDGELVAAWNDAPDYRDPGGRA